MEMQKSVTFVKKNLKINICKKKLKEKKKKEQKKSCKRTPIYLTKTVVKIASNAIFNMKKEVNRN